MFKSCPIARRCWDIIDIIYASTFVFGCWVGKLLFSDNWNRVKSLPDVKKQNRLIIGETEKGKLIHDFLKFPHMIVAGTTGYGKTNFLNCAISQLSGEIILIDLKGGDDYDKVSATNIYEAEKELSYVMKQMYKKRDKHIYVIVDEAGELLPKKWMNKEQKQPYLKCLAYVSEIARLGRGKKVHLIYATQYPTADILDPQIKQCAETRICFRLPTEIASRVALDESGAETLPSGDYGMGIYKRDIKCLVRTYKFMERDGYNSNVKEKKNEGIDYSFTLE